MSYPKFTGRAAGTALALALLLSPAQAQQDQSSSTLYYPTGAEASSVLKVDVNSPTKIRTGEEYKTEITITNLSDNLTLENVVLKQQGDPNVDVLQARYAGQQGQKQQGQKQQGQKQQQGKDQGDGQQQGGKDESPQRLRQSQDWNGSTQWGIARLQPGESKTIHVTAVGHKSGQAKSCLSVTYEPALCITRSFVRPDLQVTLKVSPKKADICEPLTFEYEVKNTGTGVARGVTLQDELPDGLKTRDGGKQQLNKKVGDLQPGQSETVTLRVLADEGGEYTTQAVAVTDKGLRSRSARQTVQVTQADLAVTLEGQDTGVAGQPLSYKATVRNEGDAPAKATTLTLEVPDDARLIRYTQKGKQGEAGQQGGTLRWELGTLKPDESRDVRVVLLTDSPEKVKVVAVTESECERDLDSLTARAQTVTEITQIPALQFKVFDRTDPVNVGAETVIEVSVKNEGSAADHDVQVKVELPKEFEFVKVEGQSTEAESDGGTVTLSKLKTLEPHTQVEWHVHVRATEPGASLETLGELTSEYLGRSIPSAATTTAVETGSQTQSSKKSQ